VTKRGAILITIVECCRPVSIDPYSDLRYVLTLLPDITNRQAKDISPAAWVRAFKPARSQPAA
jgi:hypothetical protein